MKDILRPHYQIQIVDSPRGLTAVVFREGDNPDTSEELGFFELLCGGVRPRTPEEILKSIQNVVPSEFRDAPVVIEPSLMAMLLAKLAENPEQA